MKKYFTAILFIMVIVFAPKNANAQFTNTIDFLNLIQDTPTSVFADLFDPFFKIFLDEAWEEINTANPLLTPIKIGIVDSGIDASGELHPEFRGVDLGSTPFIAKIDSKDGGHGTQVAGIIGANNVSATSSANYEKFHMNGILSGAEGLPYILEVQKPSLLTNDDVFSVFSEIKKLGIKNVDVINLTNSTPLTETIFGLDLFYAANFLTFSDILFVVAAGNIRFEFLAEELGIDADLTSPARFGGIFDNVITVGSTRLDDSRAPFSNFGNAVNVATPGENIYAPASRGEGNFGVQTADYEFDAAGTSFSAPLVTGVAGLLKAIKPKLTPAQIKQIITTTADSIHTADPSELSKTLGSACDDDSLIFRGCRLNALSAVCHPDVLDCDQRPPLPCPLSGTLSADTTVAPTDSPCVIQDTVTVPSGVTLTIEPGVIMKFDSSLAQLNVSGTLAVNGTPTSRIFFTSIRDDVGGDTNGDGSATEPVPGDWGRIFLEAGSNAVFTHSTIRFGGGLLSNVGQTGGMLSISGVHLTQSSNINLIVFSGTAVITDSEIDTARIGIASGAGSDVTISNSSIHGHTFLGASGDTTIIKAENNWWGDSSGPFHPTLNPLGSGDAVGDFVDFIPFLNTDPVGNLP